MMIETFNAKFNHKNTKVIIKDKNTEEIIKENDAWLTAKGHYKSWWEYPCEPEHGQMQYIEQEIDPDTIMLKEEIYEDEFEIVEILEEIEDCDWVVDERSFDVINNQTDCGEN